MQPRVDGWQKRAVDPLDWKLAAVSYLIRMLGLEFR